MNDDWQVVYDALLADSDSQEAFAALARLREREAHLPRDLVSGHWKERAEASEARVAQLEEALREIVDEHERGDTAHVCPYVKIAIRALAHEEEA